MITKNELEDMRAQEIETTDRKILKDITAVQIERDLPYGEKMLSFLAKIKNPYCFLCGETPVKICFSDNGQKLSKLLETHFIRIKQD